jgi:hypothetical protein
MTVFLGYGGVPISEMNQADPSDVTAGVKYAPGDSLTGTRLPIAPPDPSGAYASPLPPDPRGAING